MIKLIYNQEPDYFDEIAFPERHLEVTIEDDDDLYTLFHEVSSLAIYAGYSLDREVWNKIGDYLEERCVLPTSEDEDDEEYEQLTFNFDDFDWDDEEEEEEDEC